MLDETLATPLIRRLTLGIFLSVLLLLAWLVLNPFLVPVLWAGILAYVTWPLYRRLQRVLRNQSLCSLLLTILVALVIVAPIIWVVSVLRIELQGAWREIAARLAAGEVSIPPSILHLPVIGPELSQLLERIAGHPERIGPELARFTEQSLGEVSTIVGGVGRNVAKLGLALLTLFFLYRSGDKILRETTLVLRGILGSRIDHYLEAIGATTRAVVYGIVITAFVQGLFAGIGYAFVGLEAPVLLAIITVMFAFIPFGTPVVWGAMSIWLLLTGQTWQGFALLAWGTFVVSWVDNLVRPLVISSATRIPFLLVMFGVLGGVVAFGLIGLFLGPVVLAVLMAVWREWLEDQDSLAPPGNSPPPATSGP
jgi:predicted PurR-regulated permease PerM